MPNTTSAERRMRGSARKQNRNHSVKSRLKTLERNLLGLIEAGKRAELIVFDDDFNVKLAVVNGAVAFDIQR